MRDNSIFTKGVYLVQFSRGGPVLKQSLLITVLSVFLLGCSTSSEESVSQVPTPDVEATVSARINSMNIPATVEAMVENRLANAPTPIPQEVVKEVVKEVFVEVEKVVEVEKIVEVVVTATPTPLPTATPTPTPIPTATPNPVQIELLVTKNTDDWEYGRPETTTEEAAFNCYDVTATNTNDVAISFYYVLRAIDDDGINYQSTAGGLNGLSASVGHLESGQTIYNKRCWGGAGIGATIPVTKMELVSISNLSASVIPCCEASHGEWQKIGDGETLEQFIKFIEEPYYPIDYPFQESYNSPNFPKWFIANLSENKTLEVQACVTLLWRESSMYKYIEANYENPVKPNHVVNIQPNTLYNNVCNAESFEPKASGELRTYINLGDLGWYGFNLYSEVLGIWVRER